MATPRGNRAVIYVRESLDKWGDERAVERFEQQCRQLCDGRGLDVLRTLRDNDVRASNGNHGGGYAEVLRMLRDRQTDYVVIPVVDRFFRSLRDLEDVIDICLETGAALVAASGEIDLSHDQGRLVARLLTSVAKAETERKGARQRDANDQQARAGKRRVGGPRPFGYEDDHVTARPAEAGAIRWAADALLGGSSVTAVMREWNQRGLRTAQGGKPFTRQSVTVIMRNPRNAGLAVLPRRPDHGDRPELDNPPRKRKRLLPPEITGRGQWQAIITEEQWRAVTALLGDPARKPPRGAYTLLGGLARCRCGNKVIAGINATGKHVYRCDPQTRRGRPGPHCQQMISYAELGSERLTGVDPFVEAVIIERLSRDDLADLLAPPSAATDTAALHREAAAIRRNLDELAADRALGLVSRTQMIAATERGNARLAEITADLAASASGSALAPFAAGKAAADVWAGLDRARKRAVLDALCTVIIHPAGRGARMFNPATVELIPREGS
jgi:site-specific DNA recombinase